MTAGCTETPTAASVPRVEHTPSSATSMAEGATSSNSATAMAKASGAELSSYLGGLTLQVFLMGTWIGGLLLLPTMLILLSCGQATFATALLALAAAAYVGPPLDRQKLLAWIRANSGGMFRAMSCTREEPDCKQGPTLVAYHPHGMFSWGFFAQTAADLSTIPLAKVAPILPLQPLFRYIFVRSLGCCRSASKPSVTHTMRAEESFCILPGGFEEASICERGRDRVYLKGRAGFVKLALQHGYKLQPAYVFGEADLYHNVRGFHKLRFWLNKYNIPTIVPFGKWWCPLLPRHDVGVHTVIGKAIELPRIEQPSREDVTKWHALYIEELRALFDRHKGWASARGAAAVLEVF